MHAPLLGVCAVVLVLLGAGVLVSRDPGADPPRRVGSAVTVGKTAAPPASRPSPTPSPPPATERPGQRVDLSELVVEVSTIRGLQPTGPVSARVLSPADLAAKVAALDFGDEDPAQVEADRRLLAALRLIPPDLDLLALVRALYAEQVLGIYLPEEETLYVATGAATMSPYEEVTAAHEITHALQDQVFGLAPLRELPDAQTDAALALLSLVEGDAVLTQTRWQAQHQSAAERAAANAEIGGGPNEVLARSPAYIRAALTFPYVAGSAFTSWLFDRGGFAGIDAAYAAPPTTTEHILHPERYAAGEGAAPVSAAGEPGPGWVSAATYEFGEFDVRELFVSLGHARATRVADGWGGGEVVAWQNGAADGVALALVFDTAADAADACAALPEWYSAVAGGISTPTAGLYQGDRDVLAVACDGLRVDAGLATDGATAQRLANG